MYNRYENFPKRHFPIAPSDVEPLPHPMIIYCLVAGDVSVSDDVGTDYIYGMTQGQILPIMPTWIYAADTTASVIGLI